MIAESLGYGKVVLFGEYGVLNGGLALVYATKAGAIAQYDQSHLTDPMNTHDFYAINAFALGSAILSQDANGTWQTNGQSFPFVKETLLQMHAPFGSYAINSQDCQIQTINGLQKIGLGSSAAVVVSLLTLLKKLPTTLTTSNHTPINTQNTLDSIDQIFAHTVDIHRKVQMGIGSGVDVIASIMGGMISYSFLKQADQQIKYNYTRILKPFRKQILCVWTGKSASTTALITQIRNQISEQAFHLHASRLSEIAQEAFVRVQKIDFQSKDWFDLVRDGRLAIQDLAKASNTDLWLNQHEEIHRIVCQLGGVCKSTGAGGGDLAWVLGEDEVHERKMAEVLGERGMACFFLEMGEERF